MPDPKHDLEPVALAAPGSLCRFNVARHSGRASGRWRLVWKRGHQLPTARRRFRELERDLRAGRLALVDVSRVHSPATRHALTHGAAVGSLPYAIHRDLERGVWFAWRSWGRRRARAFPPAITPPTVAALYVMPGGTYAGLPGVDVWDETRDARTYPGPYPVVAHPPCERWGRYWFGGPSARARRDLGDDAGCFAAALEAVRRWGGVLEHPEASHAWRRFGLNAPPKNAGWIRAGIADPGWTCCVEQGYYGHRARKATWLYAVDVELPSLPWRDGEPRARLDDRYHSSEERRSHRARRLERDGGVGSTQRLSKRERTATPEAFRDLLLSMARSVYTTRDARDPYTSGRWTPCSCEPGVYWCRVHHEHAHDCACPPLHE